MEELGYYTIPKLILIAWSTCVICSWSRLPTFFSNRSLSMVSICAKFTILLLANPLDSLLILTVKG